MPAKKKSFEETFWNSANKLGGFVDVDTTTWYRDGSPNQKPHKTRNRDSLRKSLYFAIEPFSIPLFDPFSSVTLQKQSMYQQF